MKDEDKSYQLDEVLAAGDASFQSERLRRIEELRPGSAQEVMAPLAAPIHFAI